MLFHLLFFCFFCFSIFGNEIVYLKTPDITSKNLIGTSVGIRPYRKTGVRLEAERLKNKLIIHNYGYGGSGLTLSLGGSKQVLKLLSQQKTTSKIVAVLGAGVIGLTTAYDLLKKGYDVHLYSDKWTPNLTSNVGAGIWTPLTFPSTIPIEKKKLHQKLLKIAERRFLKSTTTSPEFAGVKMMPYYKLINGGFQNSNSTNHYEKVVIHFDNGLIKSGYRTYQLGIDGKLFIEDLFSKIKNKGVNLHQKQFKHLEDILSLKESIIINCMSMGSKQVFNDKEFIPVRGQLVYYKFQNEIDYVLSQSIPNSEYFFMLHPWSDRLILGGIFEVGFESQLVDKNVINQMIENAQKCLSVKANPRFKPKGILLNH